MFRRHLIDVSLPSVFLSLTLPSSLNLIKTNIKKKISQGMPRIADKQQKLGKGKGGFSPWSLQIEQALTNTLVSDF